MWGTKSEKLLWEKTDKFMKVQVWEKPDRRELRFGNPIMQSVFSRNHPNHLVLPYTRFMLLALLFSPEPTNVLHIGLGAGSIPKWLFRQYPNTQQTVIELSPSVIEAAYCYFELPQSSLVSVLNFDATRSFPVFKDQFDIIFMDAFDDDGVPSEICCTEFLQLMKSYLRPNGWLAGNTWTSSGDFKEQCDYWKSTFHQVFQVKANHKGNVILFGNKNESETDLKKMVELSKKMQKLHNMEYFKMLKEVCPVD